jgi:hypothetical protein
MRYTVLTGGGRDPVTGELIPPGVVEMQFDRPEEALVCASSLFAEGEKHIHIVDERGRRVSGDDLLACMIGQKKIGGFFPPS